MESWTEDLRFYVIFSGIFFRFFQLTLHQIVMVGSDLTFFTRTSIKSTLRVRSSIKLHNNC